MPRLNTMILLAAIAVAAPAPGAAQTGEPLGERLGRCLALKSTGADRLAVARWLLGVLASAPQAADVTTLQPGKKDASDRAMAAVFTHLIVTDCAAEAKAVFAIPGGGQAGFQVAGEALGRVAMNELMTSPETQKAIASYTRYLKQEDFKPLLPPSK